MKQQCKYCNSSNIEIIAVDGDLIKYKCNACGITFNNSPQTYCSICGELIKNPKAAIYFDGEVFCSDICAEEYEFFNCK